MKSVRSAKQEKTNLSSFKHKSLPETGMIKEPRRKTGFFFCRLSLDEVFVGKTLKKPVIGGEN